MLRDLHQSQQYSRDYGALPDKRLRRLRVSRGRDAPPAEENSHNGSGAGRVFKMGFGKGVFMKRWMKWAAVAAVGVVAVPVMGLSLAPAKANPKTARKPAGKVTPVSNVANAKKTTLAAKPVVKN